MKVTTALLFAVLAFLCGCGSNSSIYGTWLDDDKTVYFEFNSEGLFLSDKSRSVRMMAGAYTVVGNNILEVEFNGTGNAIREYAKNPKNKITVVDTLFNADPSKSTVKINMTVQDGKMTVQSKDNSVITLTRQG